MTSTINLSKNKKCERSTKYTVFGYIREYEDTLKYNVPLLINNLILCYFNDVDSWNKKYVGNNINIIDQKKQITKTDGSVAEFENAYLMNVIFGGVYKWTFKFVDILSGSIDIGIWKINKLQPIMIDDLSKNKNISYLLNVQPSIKPRGLVPDRSSMYVANDQYISNLIINDNDIIEMILNLHKLTLSYVINDHNYGVAFNVEKQSQ